VATIETSDARHVRFKLNKPWPDFLTFYSSASGAGWIVPKKYVEKVGDAGFRKHPIGAGPYKFVSFTPGIELVLEAFDGYWRKSPAVKHVVMKSIPDETTRLAGLKHGEFDIAYSIRGELAEELQHTPGLSLQSTVGQATNWIYFPEQWDPKSPWHDLRVRQAANLALDRDQMNQALFLDSCRVNNSIIPESFEYYWQPPPAVLRSGKGQGAARRSSLSPWVRRRTVYGRQLLLQHGRSRGGLFAAGWYPLQAGADGARRFCFCLCQ
jgi:peptide/nickel transport system substrate-binding protein